MTEVPSGYKQTEVGVIPEDWSCPSIQQIAAKTPNAIVGGPFGSDLVSKNYVATGIPVVRGQNMAQHHVSGDFVFISILKAKQLQANTARPNDVIFTQRGTLGQVSIVPRAPFAEYIVSQSQMKLTLHADMASTEYLYQYFISTDGQKQIVNSAIQTGVPHTNLGILRSYRIPLPPTKAEQEAITEALSDADALIESLEQLIAKKRQIKQGAMQELLTGKKRLPGFSGEWEVKRLGEVASLYQAVTISASQFTRAGYPVYGANGVVGFFDKFNHETWQVTVTCRGSTCGTVNRTIDKCWITGNAMVVSCEGSAQVDKLYVYYLLSSKDLSICITGTGQPQIVRTPLANFELKISVNVEEQTDIAAILSDMDAEIAELEGKLAKARQVKQGMMQELLTGRIRLI